MMKLQRQVSGNIRRDSNCHGDICPCNICFCDICLICGCGSAHFIDLQSQVCAIYKWENCLVELSFIDGAACQLTQFGLFIQGLIIRHRLICHHQHALIVCYVQVFRVGMLESWNRLQGAIVERTFCLQLRFFIRECMAIIGAPCWSIHKFVESHQLGCIVIICCQAQDFSTDNVPVNILWFLHW